MIKITKLQKEALEKAGLIKYRKTKNGLEIQSPNIYVANKEHLSRSKTYYVVEEPKIMKFLGLVKDKPYSKFYNNKNKRDNVRNDKQGFYKKTI